MASLKGGNNRPDFEVVFITTILLSADCGSSHLNGTMTPGSGRRRREKEPPAARVFPRQVPAGLLLSVGQRVGTVAGVWGQPPTSGSLLSPALPSMSYLLSSNRLKSMFLIPQTRNNIFLLVEILELWNKSRC